MRTIAAFAACLTALSIACDVYAGGFISKAWRETKNVATQTETNVVDGGKASLEAGATVGSALLNGGSAGNNMSGSHQSPSAAHGSPAVARANPTGTTDSVGTKPFLMIPILSSLASASGSKGGHGVYGGIDSIEDGEAGYKIGCAVANACCSAGACMENKGDPKPDDDNSGGGGGGPNVQHTETGP